MSELTINQAVIGLGANLGDPIEQLLMARHQLKNLAVDAQLRCSHFYLTSPVGYAQQPFFINAVACFDTRLNAFELLHKLHTIENQLGRVRDADNQNAPRRIDLDILLFGEQRIAHADLIIPHPRMHQRLFVLQPLAELLPQIKIPQTKITSSTTVLDVLEQQQFAQQTLYKLSLSKF